MVFNMGIFEVVLYRATLLLTLKMGYCTQFSELVMSFSPVSKKGWVTYILLEMFKTPQLLLVITSVYFVNLKPCDMIPLRDIKYT